MLYQIITQKLYFLKEIKHIKYLFNKSYKFINTAKDKNANQTAYLTLKNLVFLI